MLPAPHLFKVDKVGAQELVGLQGVVDGGGVDVNVGRPIIPGRPRRSPGRLIHHRSIGVQCSTQNRLHLLRQESMTRQESRL